MQNMQYKTHWWSTVNFGVYNISSANHYNVQQSCKTTETWLIFHSWLIYTKNRATASFMYSLK